MSVNNLYSLFLNSFLFIKNKKKQKMEYTMETAFAYFLPVQQIFFPKPNAPTPVILWLQPSLVVWQRLACFFNTKHYYLAVCSDQTRWRTVEVMLKRPSDPVVSSSIISSSRLHLHLNNTGVGMAFCCCSHASRLEGDSERTNGKTKSRYICVMTTRCCVLIGA